MDRSLLRQDLKKLQKKLSVFRHMLCIRRPLSYSVRVDDRALNEIRKIAGDNEIPIRRIYIERTVNGERVYDVVS